MMSLRPLILTILILTACGGQPQPATPTTPTPAIVVARRIDPGHWECTRRVSGGCKSRKWDDTDYELLVGGGWIDVDQEAYDNTPVGAPWHND
jgi:hypothetical protein